jgi:hypothetical protein
VAVLPSLGRGDLGRGAKMIVAQASQHGTAGDRSGCDFGDRDVELIPSYNDMLESELGSEVENGRLVRLMTKLGFINERAE